MPNNNLPVLSVFIPLMAGNCLRKIVAIHIATSLMILDIIHDNVATIYSLAEGERLINFTYLSIYQLHYQEYIHPIVLHFQTP